MFAMEANLLPHRAVVRFTFLFVFSEQVKIMNSLIRQGGKFGAVDHPNSEFDSR